jgi:ADP-ribosylglycohydrolase
MFGAICGDVIGSIYEIRPIKTTQFALFHPAMRYTDDTVLTVAVADALLNGHSYLQVYKSYFSRYPSAGYGGAFLHWAASDITEPYNSYGNGSAMRVSPVAWARETLEEVLSEAQRSAEVTHSHPDGIAGACALASAIHLALTSPIDAGKQAILEQVPALTGYRLDFTLDSVRPRYRFDVSCAGSVPHAIRAYLESDDFESAVRLAISLGGDSDTLACMAGAIAEAGYGGVPADIAAEVRSRLSPGMLPVIDLFRERYPRPIPT